MRLFNKGLLLIAIPLLGQFIFALFLLTAHRATEEIAWRDLHFRAQTQELMAASILLYRAVAILSTSYGTTDNDIFLARFDKLYDDLLKKLEFIEVLAKEEPSEYTEKTLETMKVATSQLYKTRLAMSEKGMLLGSNLSLLLVKELKTSLEDTLEEIERLIAARAKEGLSDVEKFEQRRWLFLSSIIAGFSLNMLLAAILLIVYSRNFARRFEIIIDNTKRIPAAEPLNERITGKDELADLDRVFHEMEESLRAAEARKQQLMGMVSHDIRGPLTSAQITLELLCDRDFTDVPDPIHDRLVSVDALIKRLARLVNDVLDFDKLKVGKLDLTLDAIPIADAINGCIKEVEPLANKSDVSIVLEAEDGEDSQLEAIADSERLSQIVVNLLGNAIKYSPRHSTITVRASNTTETTEHSESGFLKISIIDQGPGVPDEFKDLIFLPFEQVPDEKRSKAGTTGLGLPICKMLTELHGGKIGVDGAAGGGSEFWFTLPKASTEDI